MSEWLGLEPPWWLEECGREAREENTVEGLLGDNKTSWKFFFFTPFRWQHITKSHVLRVSFRGNPHPILWRTVRSQNVCSTRAPLLLQRWDQNVLHRLSWRFAYHAAWVVEQRCPTYNCFWSQLLRRRLHGLWSGKIELLSFLSLSLLGLDARQKKNHIII